MGDEWEVHCQTRLEDRLWQIVSHLSCTLIQQATHSKMMELISTAYHILVAVWAPNARVRESFLLDCGFRSLATVSDGDGSLNSSVQHVHRGADRDVIAKLQVINVQLKSIYILYTNFPR